MTQKILITGGAGYIGSHIVKKLLENNQAVLVLDNFSTGFIEPLEILKNKFNNLNYINADLTDKEKLIEIFTKHDIDAVVHMAAKIDVNESIVKPDEYYQANYTGGINLIEAMSTTGVNKIIFSSTAAVYGNPEFTPINESHATKPLNPYGQTKLDFEKYLTKCKKLQYIIYRYFNVGGASLDGSIGKSHLKSHDLLENIMKVALGQKKSLEIYGSDFNTPDGTAIRDFIHVEDVASAHFLALKKLNNQTDKTSKEIFNLGSETGFSIKQILDCASKITRKKIPYKFGKKREGDISVSIADSSKAKKIIKWQPVNSNLETIIATDWYWRKTHPMGYTK